jgi:hypothetical protein
MKLDWIYNPTTKITRLDITATLYYETPDGGQTIKKFEDGQLADTFYKYGKDITFLGHNPDPDCGHDMTDSKFEDAWPDQMRMLCEVYPDIAGTPAFSETCLTETGDLETRPAPVSVVSDDLHVSINRMGVPGSVQGWWDWEVIYTSSINLDDTCKYGMTWRKHKTTGKIVRAGTNHPQIPCCMWPMIHYEEVDESDTTAHQT